MGPPTPAETTSTQLIGVVYINLVGMVGTHGAQLNVLLAPILWGALPTGTAVPYPESSDASTYAWLPNMRAGNALSTGKHPYPKPALAGIDLSCLAELIPLGWKHWIPTPLGWGPLCRENVPGALDQ
ncbi:hypothetical protein DSO57_1001468 [Entomophthora muscae]|uniref:Uncharacterized protein n=1 Tax=Entomophthora muscae TaxID=34485 RepID=A0ACC2UIC9_9FUNG|nr:hypothetical protein DSO57_1001468 [Entomophthora muscae]